MTDRRNCKIIQDLLPNYIEGLTNQETNQFIEEHLNECAECKNMYTDMKQKLSGEGRENSKEKVDYLRKYNRKLRVLKSIILIIIIVLPLLFCYSARKMTILSNLVAKQADYKCSNNFHQRVIKNTDEVNMIADYYKKGNKDVYYQTITINKTGETAKKVMFVSESEVKMYYEKGKEDILNEYDLSFGIMPVSMYFDYKSLWQTFITMQKVSIKETILNGKNCYKIKYNLTPNPDNLEWEVYKDKETGLTIKLDDFEFEYEFDNVSDSVFAEPDLEKYELQPIEK